MQASRTENVHSLCQQVLLLKGTPVMQLFTLQQFRNGTIVLKESTLLLVRQGRFCVRAGKREQVTRSNQMAFFRKGTVVEFEVGPDTGSEMIEYLLLSFPPGVINEFTKIARLTTSPARLATSPTTCFMDVSLLRFIDSLQVYFTHAQTVEEELLKIKLFELLFYLSRYCADIFERLIAMRETFHADVTITVEENILNALSLQQLAVLAGRSLSSFRRDFWAMYNMAPSQWIRQKRLEKAKELLRSTNMTITDICYTIGFENIAHFSRLFKSYCNFSPLAYRQAVMQRNNS